MRVEPSFRFEHIEQGKLSPKSSRWFAPQELSQIILVCRNGGSLRFLTPSVPWSAPDWRERHLSLPVFCGAPNKRSKALVTEHMREPARDEVGWLRVVRSLSSDGQPAGGAAVVEVELRRYVPSAAAQTRAHRQPRREPWCYFWEYAETPNHQRFGGFVSHEREAHCLQPT